MPVDLSSFTLQLLTGDSDQKGECEKANLFNRKCG